MYRISNVVIVSVALFIGIACILHSILAQGPPLYHRSQRVKCGGSIDRPTSQPGNGSTQTQTQTRTHTDKTEQLCPPSNQNAPLYFNPPAPLPPSLRLSLSSAHNDNVGVSFSATDRHTKRHVPPSVGASAGQLAATSVGARPSTRSGGVGVSMTRGDGVGGGRGRGAGRSGHGGGRHTGKGGRGGGSAVASSGRSAEGEEKRRGELLLFMARWVQAGRHGR